MRLRQVDVRSFRGFHFGSLGIRQRGLTLVAGANNSGKSALMSAMDVVAGNGPGQDLPNDQSNDPAVVTASFDLSAAEKDEILAGTRAFSSELFSQIKFSFSANGPTDAASLTSVTAWTDRGFETIMGTEDGQLKYSSFRNQWSGPFREPLNLNGIFSGAPENLYAAMDRVEDFRPLRKMLSQWQDEYYHFTALRTGGKRDAEIGSASHLQPDGSNIHEVLLYLKTNDPETFDRIVSLMRSIVPEVGTLAVPTLGKVIQVGFISDYAPNRFSNIKNLGTGVEQLLLTVVVGVMQDSGSVIVIEEPETNLHPAAQRALSLFLRDVARTQQVILATHSPILLDWHSSESSVHLVKRELAISSVNHVTDELAEVLEELGVRFSDVLAAEALLIVEGKSDLDVLQQWFGEDLLDTRLAITDGGGGDNARQAELLQRWIDSADRGNRRQLLYMRDRDELPDEVISQLGESGLVHVLQRREIENYLLDPRAIQGLFKTWGLDNSVEEIATAIAEGARSTLPQIILGRVARRLQPIRLVDNRDRANLVRRGASKDEFVEHAMNKLPNRNTVRSEMNRLWRTAESDVAKLSDEDLLLHAPGEEVLDHVFMRFINRHYRKSDDAPALAARCDAPEEIRRAVAGLLEEPA